jgi:hypothetical protein
MYSFLAMSDVLKMLNNLSDNLWKQFGDPIANNKEKNNSWYNSDRIRMTHYVSRLMEERGHKHISPSKISGEKEDRVYYSERALQEAFEAGLLLAKADNLEMRKAIISELKAEIIDAINEI